MISTRDSWEVPEPRVMVAPRSRGCHLGFGWLRSAWDGDPQRGSLVQLGLQWLGCPAASDGSYLLCQVSGV